MVDDAKAMSDTIVIGYHATSAENVATILRDCKFVIKENDWDWLGHGIYFWQDAPSRAWEFAKQKYPNSPGVIVAKIRLGVCLDLCDSRYSEVIHLAYERAKESYAKVGRLPPANRGKRHDLDCAVFNFLATEMMRVDTLRATFAEGNTLYPGTDLRDQDHIQICVRNLDCILEFKQLT